MMNYVLKQDKNFWKYAVHFVAPYFVAPKRKDSTIRKNRWKRSFFVTFLLLGSLGLLFSLVYAAGSVATYSDSGYTNPASSFYQGATVYSKLTGGLASKTYYAEYWGAGASPTMQSRSSALTSDSSGVATHSYALNRFAPVGSWDVRFLNNPLYANPRRAILDSPTQGNFQMNDTVLYKFHLEDRDGNVITTDKSADLKVTLKVGTSTIWNGQNPSAANGWTFNSVDGTYTKTYTRSGANKSATAIFTVSGASTSAETGDAYFMGATPYLVANQIFGTINSYPYKLVIAKPSHEVTSGSVLTQFKLYDYTYSTEITSPSGITWTVQAKEANDYNGNRKQTTFTGSTPTYNATSGYWESTFSLPADGKYRFDIKATNSNAPEDTAIVNYAAKADFTVLDAPPTTTLTANPVNPDGEGDWYKTAPTITLTADEPGTTYYQWDSTAGSWTTYSGVFNALEGEHTLYYYSVDTANNAESTKSKVFKVDAGLPSIFEETPTSGSTVNTYTPIISAKLFDLTSGIDSSTIMMKLDSSTVSHSYDPITGVVSYTPASNLSLGKHYVDVSVKDVAGNLAISSWHFTVFGTPVGGTISSNTTWIVDGSPYIVSGVSISSGATLTIEPGAIVKFSGPGLSVAGTLIADGTSANKIYFTTIKDDSVGGDTNNDGATTSPAPGDWQNIWFNTGSSASKINNAVIKYGGSLWANIRTEGSPTITNSTIAYSGGAGISIDSGTSPTITGNTINNNTTQGIITSSSTVVINYNNIYDNASKNLYNASTGTVDARYNWWGTGTDPSSKIYGSATYDPWALSPFEFEYADLPPAEQPSHSYGNDAPSGYFGEPVNTALGNYTYEHEDLNISGKGIPLTISRAYNSLDNLYNGPFGYGWTHNYNTNLRFNPDNSITVMMADGRRDTYTDAGGGNYTPPQGIFNTLTKNADSTYTLKLKDQTKYNFNSSGYLVSQVDKFGNTTTLSYTGNLLASVTDSGGRSITLTYTSGRITKIQDQTGRNVQYGYDVNGNLTTVTDLNSKITTYSYDSNHQLTTVNEPEPSANPFLTNNYTNGKADWQKDAFLNTSTYSYDTVNKKTTATDNKSNPTIHEFDDRYRLTKSTDPLLNSVISTYGTLDVPSSVTNQNNKVTGFTYDANGNTTSTKDPLNHEITASYDLSNNNLLWTKDALLNQTTYNYDATGKFLNQIVSPIGTTSFDYYADGLLNTLTDANNHTTTFDYNTYGNFTSIQDALLKTTAFEYDAVGRMTASIDANLHKTQFVYDNEGNILTIKDPLAISNPTNRHQVDFTYDGNKNQKTFKDANNNFTQFDYDDMDNLTSVIDANNKTTSYTYDANYNLASVTDPLLHTTTYGYYDNNRLQKIIDPLNNVLEFNYDPVGNLTKTIYPNTNETYYTYYDDNLLNTATYKNEPTSYTYAYNPTHTINTVTDNTAKTFSYAYDNGNRLTSANDQTNPAIVGGFTTQRGYDGVSNLTSLIYVGTTYTYGYNARDDLISLLLPTGTVSFNYDDARNRADVNTPDNSNKHYTYNDANRITQVKNTTNSGIQTFDYTHDSNGNILSENSITYGYDVLNRLTSWYHEGVTTSYAYDDAGNLLEVADGGVPTKTFTYNAASQITNPGFTYDTNGNMTSDGTYTYIYDGENRLKEVKQGANTIATYTYDYMGRRTSVTEGGSTTYFHYDGWNVVAETNSSGSTVATYTYDNKNQPVSTTRGGNTYYYQYNAHGDVVSLTNSLGQVVNTYTYDPWGKILSATEQVSNPYRYAGYRYDASTGLYYLQHRYYRPDIYRFLTKDPYPKDLKNPQSFNSYVYTLDNPINLVDPSGLSPKNGDERQNANWLTRYGPSILAGAAAVATVVGGIISAPALVWVGAVAGVGTALWSIGQTYQLYRAGQISATEMQGKIFINAATTVASLILPVPFFTSAAPYVWPITGAFQAGAALISWPW